MSEKEFQNMFNKCFKESVLTALLNRVPKSSTKEACKILNCSKKWLLNNRQLFDYQVVDKRGTLEFKTSEILAYKVRFL